MVKMITFRGGKHHKVKYVFEIYVSIKIIRFLYLLGIIMAKHDINKGNIYYQLKYFLLKIDI